MTTTSAIVLFVKNEVYDIASWVAWHISLGFDKVYIYDDHSTDGTYEVCQIISRHFNIELNRTDIENEPNFYWRQKNSYFDACKKASGTYTWLAFLDADEYIYLSEHNTITDFLDSYEKCNAIALNWCIYGSSFRVLKDHIPIYQSFLFHSEKELDDNTLVKSIIKPEFYTFNYSDPHKFHMHDEQYLDSTSNSFSWSGSTKPVEWGRARVNHYICRSMEHYVGRINRRLGADLSNSTVYWNHFDRNEVEHHIDYKKIQTANEILNRIKSLITEHYQQKKILENRYHDKKSVEYKKTAKTFVIKTQHDSYLHLDSIDGFLSQTQDISSTNHPIYGIIYENDPENIYLVTEDHASISNINFYIKDRKNKGFCYRFQVQYLNDGSVFLKDIHSNKFLSCVPLNLGGEVSCNRDENSAWEQFFLIENSFQLAAHSLIEANESFDFFINTMMDYPYNYNDFLIAASNLNMKSRDTLVSDSNKTLSFLI